MIAKPNALTMPTVVVIGGGFSGATVVSHLAATSRRPLRVFMFEPSARLGRGIAYSPTGEHLLLNVPAAKLSVWPERPDDFVNWCASTGRPVEPGAFLPRPWFGEYAQWTMSSTLRERSGVVEFDRIPDRATGLRRRIDGKITITGESGAQVDADQVVLANGHGPTKVPPAFRDLAGDPRLLTNPWNESALAKAASKSRRLLLVGVGLTMVDVAVSLARSGYTGEIVALSRRGVLPHPHGPSDASANASWALEMGGGDLMTIARAVRARTRTHEWRGVLDSLRPHTPRLWRSLSSQQRERFIARLAVYWDAHRHRCPQESAACLTLLQERGALRVLAATILAVDGRSWSIDVEFCEKGSSTASRETFDGVILCTGPDPDIANHRSSLVESLLRAGEIRRDPLGLGIECNEHGEPITCGGTPNDRVLVIGPLRRGESWESTAVPEIRQQAALTAARALARLEAARASVAPQQIKEKIG